MREGWKEVKFGEVVEFPPKIKMVKGNKYPFIPMELIDGGYKYVKPIEEKELAGGGAKFEEGDTLFARITPCLQNGKIAQAKNLNNKPGFGSTEYFIFRGIPNVTENDYVYYLSQMKEFRDNAINSMVGASGRQRADAGHVKSFVFNLPPLETQKKIASILSGYDDLIENNLKRIKILEEMAQQTYKEWFVRMRFPGHDASRASASVNEETSEIEQSRNLPEGDALSLPKGWEKVKLGDVISFKVDNRGKNPSYYTNEGIPVLDNHLITNSPFVDLTKASRFLDEALFQNFIRRYLEKDDVLITLVGTVANITLAPKERCAIVQNTIGLRCNEKCKQTYLYQFLKNNKQTILNNNRGSAQPSVKVGDLLAIDFLLPPSKLINEYDKYCSLIFEKIQNLGYQNQRLREARDILLPRLMMGMIEV